MSTASPSSKVNRLAMFLAKKGERTSLAVKTTQGSWAYLYHALGVDEVFGSSPADARFPGRTLDKIRERRNYMVCCALRGNDGQHKLFNFESWIVPEYTNLGTVKATKAICTTVSGKLYATVDLNHEVLPHVVVRTHRRAGQSGVDEIYFPEGNRADRQYPEPKTKAGDVYVPLMLNGDDGGNPWIAFAHPQFPDFLTYVDIADAFAKQDAAAGVTEERPSPLVALKKGDNTLTIPFGMFTEGRMKNVHIVRWDSNEEDLLAGFAPHFLRITTKGFMFRCLVGSDEERREHRVQSLEFSSKDGKAWYLETDRRITETPGEEATLADVAAAAAQEQERKRALKAQQAAAAAKAAPPTVVAEATPTVNDQAIQGPPAESNEASPPVNAAAKTEGPVAEAPPEGTKA